MQGHPLASTDAAGCLAAKDSRSAALDWNTWRIRNIR